MSNELDTSLSDIETLLAHDKQVDEKLGTSATYVTSDEIKIKKADIAEQQTAIMSIFNTKPAFQVTCTQSGYMLKMAPLVYKDIVAVTNSTLSNYEYRKEIYKMLYSKITEFSVSGWKPTFEEWLKMTSLGDVESLFYGLYCATFQDKSTIKYDCPHCEATNIAEIDNKNLVRVENRNEVKVLADKISKEADTLEKIKEFSSVSDKKENTKMIKLPNSKIIFVVKTPTMYKILDILKSYKEEDLALKSSDSNLILIYTESVLIPLQDGSYSKVEEKSDVFQLIDLLDLDDFSALKNEVSTMDIANHITYCIENQTCESCKKEIVHEPIDMESLLFFQISERRLS